mgnify:CR=1 FL=1
MKDTELLLTMLINLQYLTVKLLSNLADDKPTLEEATMIVKESQKLLEQMVNESKAESENDLGFELAEKPKEDRKSKLWRLGH